MATGVEDINEEEILAEADESFPDTNAFNVLSFLEANGWYILIAALLLHYLWKNKVSHLFEKWKRSREEEKEDSLRKKDSDFYIAREQNRMAAIERMQNYQNEQALKMKKMEEERQEKKRQEFISKHSLISRGRKLNEDYNSLMGKGEPSYRAPRRTCPGGSCNR